MPPAVPLSVPWLPPAPPVPIVTVTVAVADTSIDFIANPPPPPAPMQVTITLLQPDGLVHVPDVANICNVGRVVLPPAGAAELHVVPLEVKTLPVVPGATNRGALVPLPSNTLLAVSVAAPVPPFATGSVPVTPAAGMPVQFVRTPAEGVPRFGVVRAGLVARTMLPVPWTEFESVTPP